MAGREPLASVVNSTFGRAAAGVGMLLGLGVVVTLAREVLLAGMFGTGVELEHFRLAFAIPNLLGTSLATVVVAALAPALAAYQEDPEEQASALRIAFLAAVILGVGIGLLGAVTAWWQAQLMAPGYPAEAQGKLVPTIVALWLFFALVASSFGARAYLSVRGVVWPMASSNLVLGATMCAGLLVISSLPDRLQTATTLAIAAIGAGLVVLIVHVLAIPRATLKLLFRGAMSGNRAPLVTVGTSVAFALLGHILGSAPRLIDRSAATGLESGTVAAMDFSFSIMAVPGIALGTVFVIVALPRFAVATREKNLLALRGLTARGAVSVAVATATGLVLAKHASSIVALIFARGEFDHAAVELTSQLVRWHALGLGPMVASIILAQAALSAGLVGLFLASAALRLVSKVAAVAILVPAAGLDGLAASFLIPEITSTVFLLVVLAVWYRSLATQARYSL